MLGSSAGRGPARAGPGERHRGSRRAGGPRAPPVGPFCGLLQQGPEELLESLRLPLGTMAEQPEAHRRGFIEGKGFPLRHRDLIVLTVAPLLLLLFSLHSCARLRSARQRPCLEPPALQRNSRHTRPRARDITHATSEEVHKVSCFSATATTCPKPKSVPNPRHPRARARGLCVCARLQALVIQSLQSQAWRKMGRWRLRDPPDAKALRC